MMYYKVWVCTFKSRPSFFNSTDQATSDTAVLNGFVVVWTDWTLLYKSDDAQVKAKASLPCFLLCYIWAEENKKSEIMVSNKEIV